MDQTGGSKALLVTFVRTLCDARNEYIAENACILRFAKNLFSKTEVFQALLKLLKILLQERRVDEISDELQHLFQKSDRV